MNIVHCIDLVLQELEKHRTFLILGHEDPDADCLGSQLVLGSWLGRRGKKVYLCSAGPWKRPEILGWEHEFLSAIPEIQDENKTAAILLDCSSPDRTGFAIDLPTNLRTIVIDHHATNKKFGDIRYVDPSSPATTLLIQNLIEASGDSLNKEEAETLFLGFCTDTGFFRHLEPGVSGPLESVSRLVAAGASPAKTFRILNGNRELSSLKLLGHILGRATLYCENRLLVSWETWADCKKNQRERTSDILYQLLLSVDGIEAAAMVKEQKNGSSVISLRAVNSLDVSEVASFFGGGGHRKAAGCTMKSGIKETIEQLVEVIGKRLG